MTSSYEIRPYNTRVRILEPVVSITATTRIMYFLPVEPQGSLVFGDPLAEVQTLPGFSTFDYVFAYPEFPNVPEGPWYAREEEKTLVELLMPYIAGLYPTITLDPIGVGFSKSGWGLINMMINNETLFARAICFDAPLDMDSALFDSDYLFRGEFANYDLNTRVLGVTWPVDLIQLAMWNTPDPNGFEQRMKDFAALLTTNGINHNFDDAESVPGHLWEGTWFERIFTTYLAGL